MVGLAIFVQETEHATHASPAGQKVAELRADAIACLAGLQAVLTSQE